MQREIFANLSPLDHRYYLSDSKLGEELSKYLSEGALIHYELEVEVALVRVLAKRGLCSHEAAAQVEAAKEGITPLDVYREEEKTQHNIRALVNSLRERVDDEVKPYIHLAATSMDILDTANALRFKNAALQLVVPALVELEALLIEIARREKETVQIGRTHGQHAVPITFGFAMAEYVSRLGERIKLVEQTAKNLRGKFAGAVGAYNASSLFFSDPEIFEQEVLGELGLKPGGSSSQIVEPEFLLDHIHALVSTLGVLANMGDDFRHLQRTEIGEVGEYFAKEQVGSSTMPHKRNPWNFEHVKSLWKEFSPRIMTMYMDQISEHQRDLTNSASARFLVEIVAGLVLATKRLTKVIGRLAVDRERMLKNFNETRELIIAEPLYILLATAGHPDAHECVRKLTLRSEKEGIPLTKLVANSTELVPYLQKLSESQRRILSEPQEYLGAAVRKTETLCEHWERELNLATR